MLRARFRLGGGASDRGGVDAVDTLHLVDRERSEFCVVGRVHEHQLARLAFAAIREPRMHVAALQRDGDGVGFVEGVETPDEEHGEAFPGPSP